MKINKTTTYSTTLANGKVLTASSEEELNKLYETETNVKKQTLEVKFPIVLIASDYHEFKEMQELLSEVTKEEISFREFENECCYSAVFWVGKAEPLETKQLIEEFLEGYK